MSTIVNVEFQVNRKVYWWKYLMSNTFMQIDFFKLYVETYKETRFGTAKHIFNCTTCIFEYLNRSDVCIFE